MPTTNIHFGGYNLLKRCTHSWAISGPKPWAFLLLFLFVGVHSVVATHWKKHLFNFRQQWHVSSCTLPQVVSEKKCFLLRSKRNMPHYISVIDIVQCGGVHSSFICSFSLCSCLKPQKQWFFETVLKIDYEHRARMFLFNKKAILGDGKGWRGSPLNAALKERAKLRLLT